jgi:hypothetical protein
MTWNVWMGINTRRSLGYSGCGLHFGTLHAMMSLERFATPKGRACKRGFSIWFEYTATSFHLC